MTTFNWGSRCAECGKLMVSGTMRTCKDGDYCSWHIPAAARDSMAEMYEALQSLAFDVLDGGPLELVKKVLAKAEGRQ